MILGGHNKKNAEQTIGKTCERGEVPGGWQTSPKKKGILSDAVYALETPIAPNRLRFRELEKNGLFVFPV